MTQAVPHPVIVKELPERCEGPQIRSFLRALSVEMAKVVRPSVVLDCARVQQVDHHVLSLLLGCLEEAMKRNGDVRLAAVPPIARPELESAGVRHLFRIYATRADAVNSFHRPLIERISQAYSPAPPVSAADAA